MRCNSSESPAAAAPLERPPSPAGGPQPRPPARLPAPQSAARTEAQPQAPARAAQPPHHAQHRPAASDSANQQPARRVAACARRYAVWQAARRWSSLPAAAATAAKTRVRCPNISALFCAALALACCLQCESESLPPDNGGSSNPAICCCIVALNDTVRSIGTHTHPCQAQLLAQ